jgi:hypothetical protein
MGALVGRAWPHPRCRLRGALLDTNEDSSCGRSREFRDRQPLRAGELHDRRHSSVGRRGSPWLDRSSDACLGRSTMLRAAPCCRPMVAPRVAPVKP